MVGESAVEKEDAMAVRSVLLAFLKVVRSVG